VPAPILEKLLPFFNFRRDDTGDLDRFVNQVLQPVLDMLWDEHERWKLQADIDQAESNSINAHLRSFGNPFLIAYDQDLNRRRLLARVLIDVYKAKGVEPGLVDVIRALTGIEIVSIVSPATIDAWDLGVDVLGDGTEPSNPDFANVVTLGSSPGFMRYSFQIEVPRVLTSDEREIIEQIVELVKPAHTHFVGFREPGVASPVEHWELDVSYLHKTGEPLLGDEADLHSP